MADPKEQGSALCDGHFDESAGADERTTSNARRRRCPAPQQHEFEEAREALDEIFHSPEKRLLKSAARLR